MSYTLVLYREKDCIRGRAITADEAVDFLAKIEPGAEGIIGAIDGFSIYKPGGALLTEKNVSTVFAGVKERVNDSMRVGGVWSCCGRKGYNHATTCSYAFGGKPVERPYFDDEDIGSANKSRRKNVFPPKPCCGSVGHKHKKTCTAKSQGGNETWQGLDTSEVDLVITEPDFNDIKDLQHDEKTSVQVANELNLDTIACIRAFACKTWTDYRIATRRALS